MNRNVAVLASTLALGVFVSACDSTPEPSADKPGTNPAGSGSAAGATPKMKGPFPESTDPALKDPSKATETAPATFQAKFETTAGDFTIECTRDDAPNGADRLYNLIKIGFFNDVSFFRVVKKPSPFVVQFGIHGNPEVSKVWRDANLPPDPVKGTNARGTVVYAMAGSPDTRNTQLFINLGNNTRLDGMGFAPLCKVIDDGMSTVDKLYAGYDGAPSDHQGEIQKIGNKFLREKFPELDFIKTAKLVDAAPPVASTTPDASAASSASAAPSASAGPSASAAPKAASASPKASAAPAAK